MNWLLAFRRRWRGPGRWANPALAGAVGILVGVSVALLFAPKGALTSTLQTGGPGDTGVPGGPAASAGPGAKAHVAGGRGGANSGLVSNGHRVGPGAAAGPNTLGTSNGKGGVSNSVIRIGIAVPDLGAVSALGPGYDDGDPQKQAESVLAAWHRDGLLPVNGRDVQFSYAKFNILSDPAARAACTSLIDDDKVFMVISNHTFSGPGADCVTHEHHETLVTSDGVTEAEQAMDAPYYFTTEMSESRLLRNWPHWANARGLLRGKRIGIYYFSSEKQEVLGNLKAQLARLGYGKQVVSEVTSNTEGGGPSDAVAVQRFQAAHVDLAWLVVDQLSQTNFMNTAQSNLYHPTYVGSDYRLDSTNTATMTFPASEYDGTYGFTGLRVGEGAGGVAESAEQQKCVSDYKKLTGQTVDRESNEAEYVSLQYTCDEGRAVMFALQHAGRSLTQASFIAALEQIHNMPMGMTGNVSFGPGIFAGTSTQRTIEWQGGCKCWRALGGFSPLYVP
ncbi:MAG: hypothetical protein ACJ735_10130 [Actinomycetes bacterium]